MINYSIVTRYSKVDDKESKKKAYPTPDFVIASP